MPRKIIKSDELWATNLPYSYGTTVKGGTLIFLAGAIAVDKEGKTVGKGDMKAQILKAIENVKISLKAAGATLKDVVNARYYTTDVDAFLKLAAWRCQQVPELWGSAPGSQEGAPATLVGVTKLGYEGGLVEIEVVAHIT
ncbi:MAG: RidA family protein [Dehalococcoidia bacterium]|nr:RidA family protein [Dehalococcoidia bacterium]